ncbi:hypothetical protein SSPIM334S_00373 [Streptomyces spiroverticillatus]
MPVGDQMALFSRRSEKYPRESRSPCFFSSARSLSSSSSDKGSTARRDRKAASSTPNSSAVLMMLMRTFTQPGVMIPANWSSGAASEISRATPYRQRSRKVEDSAPCEAVLVTVTSSAASSEVTSSPPTATAAASFGLERSPLA